VKRQVTTTKIAQWCGTIHSKNHVIIRKKYLTNITADAGRYLDPLPQVSLEFICADVHGIQTSHETRLFEHIHAAEYVIWSSEQRQKNAVISSAKSVD